MTLLVSMGKLWQLWCRRAGKGTRDGPAEGGTPARVCLASPCLALPPSGALSPVSTSSTRPFSNGGAAAMGPPAALSLTEPLSSSSPQPHHRASCSPHPAIYTGTSAPPSPASRPHSPRALPHSTAASGSAEGAGPSPGPFPSGAGGPRAAAMALGRLLRRGRRGPPALTTVSPACSAVPHGKVQPLGGRERRLRRDTRAVSSFFQVRADAPLESHIHPIDCEQREDKHARARKGSVKEVICPWESPMEEGRAG
ncbi:regulator of G-protein signaling 9-like [Lathamus discolor]|uniref:regulator of G-protein signaling 9-like n=1 Tax=Lathamus discolor TaxID=678569 RepID=UPI0032B746AC